MARLLIAWEIAGGFGHLVQIAPVAQALRARGHQLTLVCRDVAAAIRFDATRRLFDQIQVAPRSDGPDPVSGSTPRSYADILHYWGFHSIEGLRDLIRRWQPLMQDADAVICHHAPSAQAAALALGKAVARFGDGYTVPPATSPLADITHWAAEEVQDKVLKEARLVAILRGAGGDALASITRVGEYLGQATDFLTTWPFLDHYPQRQDGFHYGPLMTDVGIALPSWPDVPGPKLLAYLSAGHPALQKCFTAIAQLGWPCCVFSAVPLPPAPPNMIISANPFAMTQAVAMADIVIGHASHGTSAQAIRAGKPCVMLPLNAEQSMIGWQLAQLGIGLPLPAPFRVEAIEQGLRRVAADDTFSHRAQKMAELVAHYDAGSAATDLAEDMCSALGVA
jgi:UDP:flavonoid glycosyltransferase YjiC (YdhE family)